MRKVLKKLKRLLSQHKWFSSVVTRTQQVIWQEMFIRCSFEVRSKDLMSLAMRVCQWSQEKWWQRQYAQKCNSDFSWITVFYWMKRGQLMIILEYVILQILDLNSFTNFWTVVFFNVHSKGIGPIRQGSEVIFYSEELYNTVECWYSGS